MTDPVGAMAAAYAIHAKKSYKCSRGNHLALFRTALSKIADKRRRGVHPVDLDRITKDARRSVFTNLHTYWGFRRVAMHSALINRILAKQEQLHG